MNGPIVDVCFRLAGKEIPLDHGYLLFSGLARILPIVHTKTWAVHPVRGVRNGPSALALDDTSRLKIRMPADGIPEVLPLTGKMLEVAGCKVSIGIPEVRPLEPKATLKSRFVTIKNHHDTEADFAGAVRKQLGALDGLAQDTETISVEVGRRRVMKVGKEKIVGFAVRLSGLSAQASLRVQELGLGGHGR